MQSMLPELSSNYPLTREQIVAYQEDGHILLRGVCSSEEIAAYRPVLTGTVARHNTQTLKMEDRSTYAKAFIQIGNLWRLDPDAARFVLARRFAKIAAELMGVASLRLYHDQALYKEAGGGHTPWHQDECYWPLDTDKTVTMWMPLVDVSVEMGALTFATGSHKGGILDDALVISDESQEKYDAMVKALGYPIAQEALKAGDATFHAGWTLHSAPGNASAMDREVMTIIYYADGVNTLADFGNRSCKGDMEGIYPDVTPGEPAVSELTPIVYRAS
jgi:ectoine hydroxylase-related dioxygenase (phytanoyl-CoA dioxygenase family)